MLILIVNSFLMQTQWHKNVSVGEKHSKAKLNQRNTVKPTGTHTHTKENVCQCRCRLLHIMKPKHVTKSACGTFYFKDWFVAAAASGHPLRHQNKRWQMASPSSVTQNRNTVIPPYPLCTWPVTCQETGGALRHWCEWTVSIVCLLGLRRRNEHWGAWSRAKGGERKEGGDEE